MDLGRCYSGFADRYLINRAPAPSQNDCRSRPVGFASRCPRGDHWGVVQPAGLATLLRGLTAAMGHQPDRPPAPNNHSSWHGGVATGPPPTPCSTTLSTPTLPPATETPPSAEVHNQHHRRRTAQPARPAPRDPRVRCHASGRRRPRSLLTVGQRWSHDVPTLASARDAGRLRRAQTSSTSISARRS
jgi:hypothetical protein